jgi:hypothetical protein
VLQESPQEPWRTTGVCHSHHSFPFLPSNDQQEATLTMTWLNVGSVRDLVREFITETGASSWVGRDNHVSLVGENLVVIYPSDFDKSKSYPLLFYIHGGPQGSWGDSWSTRYIPQLFAISSVSLSPKPVLPVGLGAITTYPWSAKTFYRFIHGSFTLRTLTSQSLTRSYSISTVVPKVPGGWAR